MADPDEVREAVRTALREAGLLSRGGFESPEIHRKLGELDAKMDALDQRFCDLDGKLGDAPEHVRSLMRWRDAQDHSRRKRLGAFWTMAAGVAVLLAERLWDALRGGNP